MEVQMRGWPVLLAGASKTAENSPSWAESMRTSDTLCRHTASGASRPVMTAPPVTTVRDIWLLRPDSTRAAMSTIRSSGFGMAPDSMQRHVPVTGAVVSPRGTGAVHRSAQEDYLIVELTKIYACRSRHWWLGSLLFLS